MAEEENMSRRRFLAALFKAGASIPSTWAKETVSKLPGVPDDARVRTVATPPGSVSRQNLNEKCTGCQLCIEKCPTKVLRPSVSQYGTEGIMQPVMDFSHGYCDFECTVCSEVCPTGAITPLSVDDKQSVLIGIAVVSKSICKEECSICADICPASAIKMKEDYLNKITDQDGNVRFRKYPQIEEALCVGCGLCQFKCPATPVSAIHVEGYSVHK